MTLPKRTSAIALTIVTAATLTGSAVAIPRTQDGSLAAVSQEPTIVGAWTARVKPRNCATGDVAPVDGLRSLITFHEGGTLSEYGIAPGGSPALRSPGHGRWQREPGWQDHSYAFTYYRYDVNGQFAGSQKVTSGLVLDSSNDAFTSASSVEIYDANDNLVTTVCAAAFGTRSE